MLGFRVSFGIQAAIVPAALICLGCIQGFGAWMRAQSEQLPL